MSINTLLPHYEKAHKIPFVHFVLSVPFVALSDALEAFDVQDAGDALDGADHAVEVLYVKHFDGYFDMAALVRRD